MLVRVLRFELRFHAPKARVITWLYYTLIIYISTVVVDWFLPYLTVVLDAGQRITVKSVTFPSTRYTLQSFKPSGIL